MSDEKEKKYFPADHDEFAKFAAEIVLAFLKSAELSYDEEKEKFVLEADIFI